MYAFLDRVHPSALLHRKIAELAAHEMLSCLGDEHPRVPEVIKMDQGASAEAIISLWKGQDGLELPGYGDGSELDALLRGM